MIRIDKDYVIRVDEYNYIACLDAHSTDKQGNPIYKSIGFYNSLNGAIKGVLDHKVRVSMSDGEKTLIQALKDASFMYKSFEELLKKAIGENEG